MPARHGWEGPFTRKYQLFCPAIALINQCFCQGANTHSLHLWVTAMGRSPNLPPVRLHNCDYQSPWRGTQTSALGLLFSNRNSGLGRPPRSEQWRQRAKWDMGLLQQATSTGLFRVPVTSKGKGQRARHKCFEMQASPTKPCLLCWNMLKSKSLASKLSFRSVPSLENACTGGGLIVTTTVSTSEGKSQTDRVLPA